jgi:hypothetical protein
MYSWNCEVPTPHNCFHCALFPHLHALAHVDSGDLASSTIRQTYCLADPAAATDVQLAGEMACWHNSSWHSKLHMLGACAHS